MTDIFLSSDGNPRDRLGLLTEIDSPEIVYGIEDSLILDIKVLSILSSTRKLMDIRLFLS